MRLAPPEPHVRGSVCLGRETVISLSASAERLAIVTPPTIGRCERPRALPEGWTCRSRAPDPRSPLQTRSSMAAAPGRPPGLARLPASNGLPLPGTGGFLALLRHALLPKNVLQERVARRDLRHVVDLGFDARPACSPPSSISWTPRTTRHGRSSRRRGSPTCSTRCPQASSGRPSGRITRQTGRSTDRGSRRT